MNRSVQRKVLRWQDVDLLNDTLTIHKSKTDAGLRTIPLNREASDTLVQLRTRAETFGDVLPEHYVFASFKPVGRFDGKELVAMRVSAFDPTQPIGSWKKAWRKLTEKAGLKVRFHDLRHDAISRLLTNPNVSIQTAKSIAGHVSQRMVDRYAHIQLRDKRNALEGLSGREGYVISNVIKGDENTLQNPQVIESIGRRVRI